MNRFPSTSRVCAALIAVVVAVCAISTVSAVDLNGFMKEEGHGDAALSYTHENFDAFWVGTTKVKNLGETTTQSAVLWLDYGITEDLTLIANVPWIKAEGGKAFDGLKTEGIQDVSVMLKYRFFTFGDALRSDLIAAGGFRSPGSNYPTNVSPVDIGDGTADWLARLVYQLRWNDLYFSQQAGYDRRGGDAPDAWRFYTEVGYSWETLTFTGFFQDQKSNGGSDIGDPGFTFTGNDKDFNRAGLKVYWRATDQIGVSAWGGKVLNGRNVGDATVYSVGVNFSY